MKPDLDELEQLLRAPTKGERDRAHYVSTTNEGHAQIDAEFYRTRGRIVTDEELAEAFRKDGIALITDLRAKDRRLDAAVRVIEGIHEFKPDPDKAMTPHTQIAVHAKHTAAAFLSSKENDDA